MTTTIGKMIKAKSIIVIYMFKLIYKRLAQLLHISMLQWRYVEVYLFYTRPNYLNCTIAEPTWKYRMFSFTTHIRWLARVVNLFIQLSHMHLKRVLHGQSFTGLPESQCDRFIVKQKPLHECTYSGSNNGFCLRLVHSSHELFTKLNSNITRFRKQLVL